MNMTDPDRGHAHPHPQRRCAARHDKIDVPASKLKVEIARILKDEGYIANYRRVERRPAGRARGSSCKLRPGQGEPVITGLRAREQARPPRLLRQGRDPAGLRRPRHRDPVSTSRGVMTGREARERPAWAARSSATSGKEQSHVAHRKKADPDPQGVKVQVGERRASRSEGPKGKLRQPVAAGHHGRARRTARSELARADDERPAARLPRPGCARWSRTPSRA